MNEISNIIRTARSAQRMTLEQFSKELGCTKGIVGMWENGQRQPEKARVAAWKEDPRPWVHIMGIEVFDAMYPGVIRSILAPAARTEPCPGQT